VRTVIAPNTALLLIDIQNDYFPGGRMELVGSIEASLKAAAALQAFRELEWPLVHVRHESLKPTATFFLPGTAGAEIHESVRPLLGEMVVTKHFPNAFRETGLGSLLGAAGATRLVIAGMMTHMCVDATTRAAFDLGYDCVVLKDACATRGLSFDGREVTAENVHAAFLAALGSAYAHIVSASEAASG
jgi:nicotinamidase-related amidase